MRREWLTPIIKNIKKQRKLKINTKLIYIHILSNE